MPFAMACAMLVYSYTALSRPNFDIAEQSVASGQRVDFRLTIAAGTNDPATFIPVTVIHGKHQGPTVLMAAGVHGFEFTPILALQALAERINPSTLSGTLILVKVANIAAFEQRAIYVNPYDRKNLNRSFPGAATGTQTERVAFALSTKLIAKADIVFDLHSGDGGEWLDTFVGVYGGPLATNYKLALELAETFNFPNIVRYKMLSQKQIDTGRSLNRQAVAQGLPTLLVEIGENGKREPQYITQLVNGVSNALQHLKMIPKRITRTPAKQKTRYFDGTSSVKAKYSGLWFPVQTKAQTLKKGDKIGTIKNYSGKVLETITAPTHGYTLYGLAGPAVNAGESVVTLAKPVQSFE